MKKITTLLLCIILVMSMHFPANASEQGKLSNMTEEECIEFLKEAGVSIPTDYEDEMMWGSFVKK